MMDTSGAFIGVLLAGGALWLLQGNDELISYRLVFGFAALLALCSFIISFFVDEDTNGGSHNANEKRTPSVKGSGLSLFSGLGRDYWITLAILGVFAFANSSDAFLLLRASHVGLSPLQVVMVYALYNLSYALFSYRAGTLSDRYGRWQMIAIGWTLYATVYGGIALTNSHYIWGLFLIYGLYMALTEGVSKALIVDSVPADKRGSALGLLYLVLGCSALTSNILAGYLWENFGMSSPFWVGSFTAFGGVIIIFLSGRLRASSPMASS